MLFLLFEAHLLKMMANPLFPAHSSNVQYHLHRVFENIVICMTMVFSVEYLNNRRVYYAALCTLIPRSVKH